MIVSIFTGIFAGLIGGFFWAFLHFLAHWPAFYNQLNDKWHYFPVLSGLVTFWFILKPNLSVGESQEKSINFRALSEVYRLYHFGSNSDFMFSSAPSITTPRIWIIRAGITLLNVIIGGVLGLVGALLEFFLAFQGLFVRWVPRLYRLLGFQTHKRARDVERLFVLSALTSALSLGLGAPFAAAFFACGLLQVQDFRSLFFSVFCSLLAYFTAMLSYSNAFTFLHVDAASEYAGFLGDLFSTLRPQGIEFSAFLRLFIFSFGLGSLSYLVINQLPQIVELIEKQLEQIFSGVKKKKEAKLAFLVGSMAFVFYFVPFASHSSLVVAENLGWLNYSSGQAFGLLIAKLILFIFAVLAFPSAGLFVPQLVFGALLGYTAGSIIYPTSAVLFAIATSLAFFSCFLRQPVAVVIMTFEVARASFGYGNSWSLIDTYVCLIILAAILPGWFAQWMLFRKMHRRDAFPEVSTRPSLLDIALGLDQSPFTAGKSLGFLKRLKVHHALKTDVTQILSTERMDQIRVSFQTTKHAFVAVKDEAGKYLGLIEMSSITPAVRHIIDLDVTNETQQKLSSIFNLNELVDDTYPTVDKEESLEKAWLKLKHSPCVVVLDADRKFCGLVYESDIEASYQQQIFLYKP